MSGVPVVDTSETCLVLWASFPSSLLPQLDAMRALTPEHIMKVTPKGSWIPLWRDQADALLKVLWCSDTTEVAMVKVVFSSLGFGHYYLTGTLQTEDWKHWRFQGTLPYEKRNALGQEMVRVESVVFTVEDVNGSSHANRMRINE